MVVVEDRDATNEVRIIGNLADHVTIDALLAVVVPYARGIDFFSSLLQIDSTYCVPGPSSTCRGIVLFVAIGDERQLADDRPDRSDDSGVPREHLSAPAGILIGKPRLLPRAGSTFGERMSLGVPVNCGFGSLIFNCTQRRPAHPPPRQGPSQRLPLSFQVCFPICPPLLFMRPTNLSALSDPSDPKSVHFIKRRESAPYCLTGLLTRSIHRAAPAPPKHRILQRRARSANLSPSQSEVGGLRASEATAAVGAYDHAAGCRDAATPRRTSTTRAFHIEARPADRAAAEPHMVQRPARLALIAVYAYRPARLTVAHRPARDHSTGAAVHQEVGKSQSSVNMRHATSSA